MPEYTFHGQIYKYASVSTENSVIIFGGQSFSGDVRDVVEFRNMQWFEIGEHFSLE